VVTYNVQTDQKVENEQQTNKFLTYNIPGIKALMYTDPDVVNLQEVPLGGVQWLEKNYRDDYKIVYAAKRLKNSEEKKNDYTVILYKKSRFEPIEKKNYTPSIKTKYYSDNSGHFLLLVNVKDRVTKKPISLVNTHIKGGFYRKKGNEQVAEIVKHLQDTSHAVVAGDFNGTVDDNRMVTFAEYGFIHDPVTDPTEPSKNRKIDHILFKGSGRSVFIQDMCEAKKNINGSDHYPLSCRVFLL